jgi:hypothetical protein
MIRGRKLASGILIPTLSVVFMVMLLSSTMTTEVQGASGILEHFTNGDAGANINFTRIEGEDNTDYSFKLPKQSNILEARMNFTGDAFFKENVNRTIKSSWDWRQGSQTPADTLIYEGGGLHLDMERLAPFEKETTMASGSNVYSAASGDFNTDGRLDLVVTNYDSDSVTVFIQSAQNKLVKKSTIATSDQPMVVRVGDMDNDKTTDFAVGCYGAKKVDIFISKGDGTFKTRTSVNIGRLVRDLDIEDVTGDRRDDIVLSGDSDYGMIWRQESGGTFSKIFDRDVTIGQYTYYQYNIGGCAIGDFNSDGRNDVTWVSSYYRVYNNDYIRYGIIQIYLQSTSGTFSTSFSYRYWAYTNPFGVDAGDVNGDGKDDIVYTNQNTGRLRVFYQRATGGFSGPTSISVGGKPTQPRIADFDGDRKNDVAVGGTTKILAFVKQKDGALSTSKRAFDSSNEIQDITSGDFNGDGYIDAITANRGGNNIGIWYQRREFRGNWVSNPIKMPLKVRYINFTYSLTEDGGETHLYFTTDGSNWTEIENGTTYDLVNRTETYWVKLTFYSDSASKIDIVNNLHMNMTYQAFPTNLRLDLGRDGMVEWNITGELIGSTDVTGLAEALTEYVQNGTHPPDAEDYVTIPVEIYSRTPGYLTISDIYILFNNATRKPQIVSPTDNSFVNATPTFRFYANDSDDDLLVYKLQITKASTDFTDLFNTMTFDMRRSLYDEQEGEGFPNATFPQGVVASFTLPKTFALEDDTRYKWRFYAFDGYLMSKPSKTFYMKVDSFSPIGHSSSPKYATNLDFEVTWTAEDVTPGSGLAPEGTYDVQYRRSKETHWTDWLIRTTETSKVFNGEEGGTYYFRMRARDAVMNEQLYIGGKGDTQTTVDTKVPSVTWADMPSFQDTRAFIVRWIGMDHVPGSSIKEYTVQVKKEGGKWTNWLVEFRSSQSVYTADSDTTYSFRVRAIDNAGNQGDWGEEFTVRIDATPPVIETEPYIKFGDTGTWTDLHNLTIYFIAIDLESGVRNVELGIGTNSDVFDVLSPTAFDYPDDGVLTIRNLDLKNGERYYVGARFENFAGAWSDWVWSTDFLVAIPGPESTISFPTGTFSDTKVTIDITVDDPGGFNVTLGDLRMRSAMRIEEEWSWSDWERVSNARDDVTIEVKRGFRYQFKYRARNELSS